MNGLLKKKTPAFIWFRLIAFGTFLGFWFLCTTLGLMIDSLTRSLMGYKLIEYSLGLSTATAILYFAVAGGALAFKTSTGIQVWSDSNIRTQFKGLHIRFYGMLIGLVIGSIASGMATKSSEDEFTHMSAAIFAIVPVHWVADTWIIGGRETAVWPVIKEHFLHIIIRFASYMALLILAFFVMKARVQLL